MENKRHADTIHLNNKCSYFNTYLCCKGQLWLGEGRAALAAAGRSAVLCWWTWMPCVATPGTDQRARDPADSSVVVIAAVAVGCAACDVPDGGVAVEEGPDATWRAEPGTEQGPGEEAVKSERKAEIVPGLTGAEKSVLAVAAAAADEHVPEATAWSAGADGPAATAEGITALDS